MVLPLPLIRIGGVPEHFNYPIRMACKLGLDVKHGVKLEFIEEKCGTGKMLENLKSNKVDLIVALTEGIVADIAFGNSDVQILGTYVDSPLTWAISTSGKRKEMEMEDVKDAKFGISRHGSGSELMTYVLAKEQQWPKPLPESFEVIGSFSKLRQSVINGDTDCFLWETFMTKPFHDSEELFRIGEITSLWPCFMIAGLRGRKEIIELKAIFACLHEASILFQNDLKMINEIATEYNL
eukprot:g350.t1